MTKNLHLNELGQEIHAIAVSKGWWGDTSDGESETYRKAWKGEGRTAGDVLALIHSEVSEVLEEFRDGHALNETYFTLNPLDGDNLPAGTSGIHPHEFRYNDGVLEYRLNPHLYEPGEDTGWLVFELGDAPALGVSAKPEGIPIEMADIIIRVLDAAVAWGIDIDKAVSTKMDFNKTRPLKHGGKRI